MKRRVVLVTILLEVYYFSFFLVCLGWPIGQVAAQGIRERGFAEQVEIAVIPQENADSPETPEPASAEEILAPKTGNNTAILEEGEIQSAGRKKYSWWYRRKGLHQPVEIDPVMLELLEAHGAVFQGKTEEKVVYLTWDEGYENGYTDQILDVLREEGVAATFFITGYYLEKNEALVMRMIREGHLVGSHSWSHQSMPDLPVEEMKKELLLLATSYQQRTGQAMAAFFRPPMGEFNELSLLVAEKLGYRVVFWSFAYRDWEVDRQQGKDHAVQSVMGGHYPGVIMLLHAVYRDNAEGLREILQSLKKEGYEFRLLTEIR